MARARGPNRGGKAKDPLAWDDTDDVPPAILRAQRRIKESLTGTGLKDFVFNASPLVQDVRDNLKDDFPALEHLCLIVAKAARTLDDTNWDRFLELPVLRQHCMDYEVHTQLFSKIEPTWKTLLTAPRGSSTPCVFLHLGTEPTSTALGDLLDKMGWFGVNMGPQSPPAHLREKIDHVQLDPLLDKDDILFKELTAKKGGCYPRPKFFRLAFVQLHFSPDDPILDSSDEEDGGEEGSKGKGGGMESIAEELPEVTVLPDGPSDPSSPSKPPKKKGLHDLGTEACGYGKLGVTRGMHVRRRLRALRNVLNVALSRLENEGTLVITWSALPFHPMLFFLTRYLRGLFMRVHLITPDSIKSWEVYILCAKFKRGDKDNPGKGGGNEFKSFLDGAYRANSLDDVLLWTLTSEAEKVEVQGQQGTLALGYQELWTVFANKFEALLDELCAEVTDLPPPPAAKRLGGQQQQPQQQPQQQLQGRAQAQQQQPPGQGQRRQQAPVQASQAAAASAKKPAATAAGGKQQRSSPSVGSKGDAKGDRGKETPLATTSRRNRSKSPSASPSPSRSGSKEARGSSKAVGGGRGGQEGSGRGEGGGGGEGGKGERQRASEREPEIDLHETPAMLDAEKNRRSKELARGLNTTDKASAAGLSKEDYERQLQDNLRAGAATDKWKVMDNSGIQRFIPKEKLFVPNGVGRGGKDKEKRKLVASGPLQLRRSQPTLSCSLGAAAGTSYTGFPDREAFVASYPLLAHALDCTELNDRRWHRRRELLGTRVVPKGEKGGVMLSEDLLRSPPGSPVQPPSKPSSPHEARRAQSLPSPPKFKRTVPPPLLPMWSGARGGVARPL